MADVEYYLRDLTASDWPEFSKMDEEADRALFSRYKAFVAELRIETEALRSDRGGCRRDDIASVQVEDRVGECFAFASRLNDVQHNHRHRNGCLLEVVPA